MIDRSRNRIQFFLDRVNFRSKNIGFTTNLVVIKDWLGDSEWTESVRLQ